MKERKLDKEGLTRRFKEIVKVYQAVLEKSGLSMSEITEKCGLNYSKASYYRYFGASPNTKFPNVDLVVRVGEVVGVSPGIIKEAEQVCKELSKGKKQFQKKAKKEVSAEDRISSVEGRIKKSRNYWHLALREVKGIEEDIDRIVGILGEKLRSLDGLRKALEIFEK